jgi:hypothetical protein
LENEAIAIESEITEDPSDKTDSSLLKGSLDDWSKPSKTRGERVVLGSKKERHIVPVPGTGNRYYKRGK